MDAAERHNLLRGQPEKRVNLTSAPARKLNESCLKGPSLWTDNFAG
jgi:hypothetical protein